MWFASLKFTKIHTGSNFLQDYKHSALHLLAHSYALAHRAGMERNSKLKHLGRHEQSKCNLSLEIKCFHQRKLTKSWNYFKPSNSSPYILRHLKINISSVPLDSSIINRKAAKSVRSETSIQNSNRYKFPTRAIANVLRLYWAIVSHEAATGYSILMNR